MENKEPIKLVKESAEDINAKNIENVTASLVANISNAQAVLTCILNKDGTIGINCSTNQAHLQAMMGNFVFGWVLQGWFNGQNKPVQ